MATNPKIVGITAAMPDGTGLDIVQKQYPKRVYDVGIAEGSRRHLCRRPCNPGSRTPVVAIYSIVLAKRAFDHDCT